MEKAKRDLKRKIALTVAGTVIVMAIISLVSVTNVFAQEKPEAPAQSATATANTQSDAARAQITGFAFLAAALAFGLGAVGAGIAVGNVGSAAMGAIGEKPEIAGQAIIFVALAEGIMVFGFIIAILILGRA